MMNAPLLFPGPLPREIRSRITSAFVSDTEVFTVHAVSLYALNNLTEESLPLLLSQIGGIASA